MKATVRFPTAVAVCLVFLSLFLPTGSFAGYWTSADWEAFYSSYPLHASGFTFTLRLWNWEGQYDDDYWFVQNSWSVFTTPPGGTIQILPRQNAWGHAYALDVTVSDIDIPPYTYASVYAQVMTNAHNTLFIDDFQFTGPPTQWWFPILGFTYPADPVPPGSHIARFFLRNSDPDSTLHVVDYIRFRWDTTWHPAESQWGNGWDQCGVEIGQSQEHQRDLPPGDSLEVDLVVPDSDGQDSFIYAKGMIQVNGDSTDFRFGHQENFIQPVPIDMRTWGRLKSSYR